MPLEEGHQFWLNLTNEVVDKYSPDLLLFDSDLYYIIPAILTK